MTFSTLDWISYGIALVVYATFFYAVIWAIRLERRKTARYIRRIHDRDAVSVSERVAWLYWRSPATRKKHYQAALAITVRRAAETHPLRLAAIFPLAHVTDTPTLKEVV